MPGLLEQFGPSHDGGWHLTFVSSRSARLFFLVAGRVGKFLSVVVTSKNRW